ncbi:hypothetical protein HZS_4956 [Henneguya salminicola]|nr:hypothetical protein HZS_4956 [Henneguya salminicola]
MLHIYPNAIYPELLSSLKEMFEDIAYKFASKSSIPTFRQPPLRHKRNDQPFPRRFWEGEIHGEHHTVMIWAINKSLCMMRYKTHTYIDATFRSILSPFTQSLKIMAYDVGTELNIPCI